MSDRITYAMSLTPIETLIDEGANEHDVISGEIRKSLGCSGSCAVSDYAGAVDAQGYSAGAVNYREATDDASIAISTESAAKFVFIKNKGYVYSSATALGAVSTNSLKVMISTTVIAILASGEGIILKDVNGGIDATGIYVQTVTAAGASVSDEHLAVEFLIVN